MLVPVVVVLSAILVFLEAGRDEALGYSVNKAGWTIGTLLVWLIAFPAYLISRSKLHETMIEQYGDTPNPVISSGLAWGLYVLGVMLALISFTLPA